MNHDLHAAFQEIRKTLAEYGLDHKHLANRELHEIATNLAVSAKRIDDAIDSFAFGSTPGPRPTTPLPPSRETITPPEKKPNGFVSQRVLQVALDLANGSGIQPPARRIAEMLGTNVPCVQSRIHAMRLNGIWPFPARAYDDTRRKGGTMSKREEAVLKIAREIEPDTKFPPNNCEIARLLNVPSYKVRQAISAMRRDGKWPYPYAVSRHYLINNGNPIVSGRTPS